MRRAALAFLLVACTASGERLGVATQPIQGGTDDGADTFAVAVLDDAGGVCSGTLIAPNLVLTARHCVANGGSDPIDCSTDRFDATRSADSFRVSTKAVDAIFENASYQATKVIVPTDTLFCGNDIALLVLDKAVANATPVAPSLDVPNATKITAIGYGTSAPGGMDDGSRRRRDNVSVECVPGIPALDCNLSTYDMAKTELAAGDGLCEGDSGSGAYVIASGGNTVLGVLSRAAEDNGKCIDAIYARTDPFGALLIATAKDAAAAGGYPVPDWATPSSSGSDGGGVVGGEDATAAPPDGDPAAPSGETPTVTTTKSGCSASPANSGVSWVLALFVAPFIRRRRSSHSRV